MHQLRRILHAFAAAASLILLLCGVARAFPALHDDAGEISRIHCRLLLRSLEPAPKAPDRALLDALGGRADYSRALSDAEVATRWQQMGSAPDMGFLVGERYSVAGREERKNLNFYLTRLITQDFALIPAAEGAYAGSCRMHVSITQTHEATDEHAAIYQAQAASLLPSAMQEALPIIYTLEKTGVSPWRITGVTLGTTNLADRYQSELAAHIAEEGFDGAVRALINRMAGR